MAGGGMKVGAGFVDVELRFPELGAAAAGVGRGLAAALHGTGSLINASMAPLRAINGTIGATANGIRATAGLIGSLTGSVRNLMSAGGGIGGAMSVGFIAKEAIDAETALSKLRRVTNLSEGDFAKLADQLRGMAGSMAGVKLEDVFGIATFGAKLGVGGKELNLFTRDIARVSAVLDDIPAEQAATEMARLLNVFHLGYTETIRLASALNRLDIDSTASGKDILNMTTRMSGMAATMGLSLPKTMALAAALREAGVEAEVGGTAMSQLMGKMAGKDMPAFAKMAGMTREAFKNLVGTSPLDAIKAIAAGLGKMDEFSAIHALEGVGLEGQRTRGTLLQLVQVLPKLDKLVKASEDDWGSMASILKGFGDKAGTTAAQIEKLWNNLKLAAAAIGTSLMPILRAAVEGLTNLMADMRVWFEGNAPAVQRWAAGVGRGIQLVGVLFREFPRFVELGMVTAREKLEQFQEFTRRFVAQLWQNIKAGFYAGIQIIYNIMSGMAAFLGDLFSQVGANLSARLTNAFRENMPRALGGGGPKVAVPGIAPDPGKFGDIMENVQGFPGFKGLLDNLPNRNAQKAAIVGKIAGGEAAMQAEKRQKARQDDAADAQARADADRKAKLQARIRMRGRILQPIVDQAAQAAQAKRNRKRGQAAAMNPFALGDAKRRAAERQRQKDRQQQRLRKTVFGKAMTGVGILQGGIGRLGEMAARLDTAKSGSIEDQVSKALADFRGDDVQKIIGYLAKIATDGMVGRWAGPA